LMVNFEAGLGKSRSAIECIRQEHHDGGVFSIVVCPASVRGNWLRECERWAPELTASVVWPGDDLPPRDQTPNVLIVSYEWLRDHVDELDHDMYSCCVWDECHLAKSSRKSKGEKRSRSEAALKLSQDNPHALKLGLTATPVANKIEDLWHQAHVLSPGRFSSWFRFVRDYCETSEGDWGGLIVGDVKKEREEELAWRVNAISIRKTKAEVAHLLPPITVGITWYKSQTKAPVAYSPDALNAHVVKSATVKCTAALVNIMDMVADAPSGGYRIAVITHLISSAETLATMIKEALRKCGESDDVVECITGNVPTRKRDGLLRSACVRDKSILVATMHSIGVGVDDLKVFKNVIMVELYW